MNPRGASRDECAYFLTVYQESAGMMRVTDVPGSLAIMKFLFQRIINEGDIAGS